LSAGDLAVPHTDKIVEYLSVGDLAVPHTDKIVEYLSAGDLAVPHTPYGGGWRYVRLGG
jgi:hypothetical protein